LLIACLVAAGCTRAHYRKAADREAYTILKERVTTPAYEVGRTRVEPDPVSRLADPFDPRPPDEATGRPGRRRVHGPPVQVPRVQALGPVRAHRRDREPRAGRRPSASSRGSRSSSTRDKAVEVALVNSREFQTAVESLYLQALSLTLNRFEFDLRWFGRNATTFTHTGTSAFPTETNVLNVDTNVGFNRNLAAGGQLLVDFANSVVVEYVGGTTQVRSNLGIQFIQPLLRGFGRQVRLEGLTQAERDTLYAVREYARFRKQFWAGIAVGASSRSFRSSGRPPSGSGSAPPD
jgi:hypothetical protein